MFKRVYLPSRRCGLAAKSNLGTLGGSVNFGVVTGTPSTWLESFQIGCRMGDRDGYIVKLDRTLGDR
jgi:hypothetical protein